MNASLSMIDSSSISSKRLNKSQFGSQSICKQQSIFNQQQIINTREQNFQIDQLQQEIQQLRRHKKNLTAKCNERKQYIKKIYKIYQNQQKQWDKKKTQLQKTIKRIQSFLQKTVLQFNHQIFFKLKKVETRQENITLNLNKVQNFFRQNNNEQKKQQNCFEYWDYISIIHQKEYLYKMRHEKNYSILNYKQNLYMKNKKKFHASNYQVCQQQTNEKQQKTIKQFKILDYKSNTQKKENDVYPILQQLIKIKAKTQMLQNADILGQLQNYKNQNLQIIKKIFNLVIQKKLQTQKNQKQYERLRQQIYKIRNLIKISHTNAIQDIKQYILDIKYYQIRKKKLEITKKQKFCQYNNYNFTNYKKDQQIKTIILQQYKYNICQRYKKFQPYKISLTNSLKYCKNNQSDLRYHKERETKSLKKQTFDIIIFQQKNQPKLYKNIDMVSSQILYNKPSNSKDVKKPNFQLKLKQNSATETVITDGFDPQTFRSENLDQQSLNSSQFQTNRSMIQQKNHVKLQEYGKLISDMNEQLKSKQKQNLILLEQLENINSQNNDLIKELKRYKIYVEKLKKQMYQTTSISDLEYEYSNIYNDTQRGGKRKIVSEEEILFGQELQSIYDCVQKYLPDNDKEGKICETISEMIISKLQQHFIQLNLQTNENNMQFLKNCILKQYYQQCKKLQIQNLRDFSAFYQFQQKVKPPNSKDILYTLEQTSISEKLTTQQSSLGQSKKYSLSNKDKDLNHNLIEKVCDMLNIQNNDNIYQKVVKSIQILKEFAISQVQINKDYRKLIDLYYRLKQRFSLNNQQDIIKEDKFEENIEQFFDIFDKQGLINQIVKNDDQKDNIITQEYLRIWKIFQKILKQYSINKEETKIQLQNLTQQNNTLQKKLNQQQEQIQELQDNKEIDLLKNHIKQILFNFFKYQNNEKLLIQYQNLLANFLSMDQEEKEELFSLRFKLYNQLNQLNQFLNS